MWPYLPFQLACSLQKWPGEDALLLLLVKGDAQILSLFCLQIDGRESCFPGNTQMDIFSKLEGVLVGPEDGRKLYLFLNCHSPLLPPFNRAHSRWRESQPAIFERHQFVFSAGGLERKDNGKIILLYQFPQQNSSECVCCLLCICRRELQMPLMSLMLLRAVLFITPMLKACLSYSGYVAVPPLEQGECSCVVCLVVYLQCCSRGSNKVSELHFKSQLFRQDYSFEQDVKNCLEIYAGNPVTFLFVEKWHLHHSIKKQLILQDFLLLTTQEPCSELRQFFLERKRHLTMLPALSGASRECLMSLPA